MEITHSLGILSINKNIDENVGFLLTNKKGSYCSFFNTPSSRYQGLFYFDEKTIRMYKFIENIEVISNSSVSSLKNKFYFIERKKDNVIESFLMPKGFNSLVYELSANNEIDLILDCKDSYDNREWGRYYNIYDKNDYIIIKFTKRTDVKEDSNNEIEEFTLYLAVKSDNNTYEKNDKWVERYYSYDEERKSMPFKRYVYSALRLKGSKFIFSMSKNENIAIKECGYIFNNLDEIKNKEKEYFFSMLKNESVKRVITNKNISKETKVACINAFNSLNNLIVENKDNYGLIAGLPWFFQFWSRDTLVSLKALSKINSEFAKKILFDYLNKINDNGRILKLAGSHISSNLESADAHGWLFFRCNELVEKINKDKESINSIKNSIRMIKDKNVNPPRIKDRLKKWKLILHKKENEYHKKIYEIESSIEKSLYGLLKHHTKDGFEFNEAKETWMDTEFEDDNRKGIRIEIQALRLHMYKLMFELTQNQKYKVLENALNIQSRQKFWNSKILADGIDDFTIRPNIFIAAYVYLELLTNKEWEICFDSALKSLWLNWGGLSTIDKNNRLYAEINTGEDIKSYHRGDSWFWINNLSAIMLNKINKIKFNKYIKKIIESSTEEILWKECIGCHAELSSAKELTSKGCFNQAWSNAMFIELVDEIFNN